MTLSSNVPPVPLNSNLICLGVITTVHGVRGAVKIKTFTQNPENLTHYGPLKDAQNNSYRLRILEHKINGIVIASIEGINDRNKAEALRGVELYIERDLLPEAEGDEFYYNDLVGLKVVDLKGHEVGQVKAVHNFGAGDLLELILLEGQSTLFPFRKESVPEVNVKARVITINSNFLLTR